MSDFEQNKNRSFSKFDDMSTEALKNILRNDSYLPEDEESDMEAILYIVEVVARREKEQPSVGFTDADTAWKTFTEKYMPAAGDGRSLYEDETPDNITPFKADSRPRTTRRALTRAACIAAVFAAVIVAGSVTAYALGYDLWGAVANWTAEAFGFSRNSQSSGYNPEYQDILIAMEERGVTLNLVPRYLPDGYVQDEFYAEEMGGNISFFASFINGNETIALLLQLPAYAQTRASDYIQSCYAVTTGGNGAGYVTVDFNINATSRMSTIGSTRIAIKNSSGSTVYNFYDDFHPTMMGSNRMSYTSSVTYYGTANTYYYAVVYFYAGDSSGGDTDSYTTSSAKA